MSAMTYEQASKLSDAEIDDLLSQLSGMAQQYMNQGLQHANFGMSIPAVAAPDMSQHATPAKSIALLKSLSQQRQLGPRQALPAMYQSPHLKTLLGM